MRLHTKASLKATLSPGTKQRFARPLALVWAAIGLVLLTIASSASASKEVIAYFGTEAGNGTQGGEFGDPAMPGTQPGDTAVNTTGAGPADAGDIYVVDPGNDRIQRFGQDDNGTPTNPYDDTFPFISAWGADVDGAIEGGSDYEICTVAADCKAAVASGGNGSLNFRFSSGKIAVDQDSGDVYVIDTNNFRINVYRGDGTFLRSFGVDVVESGPGNSGTGYEICVAADGDFCKVGVAGSGPGQLDGKIEGGLIVRAAIAVSQPDGNPGTGTVFVSDEANARVHTYALDGSAPTDFGSSAEFHPISSPSIAVDSRGIVYIADSANQQQIVRYDSENANGSGVGFLSPIPAPPVVPSNSNGTVGLEVDPDSDGPGPDSDVLYVLRTALIGGETRSVIQQFGPLNSPGLTAPPSAVDDTHGTVAGFNFTADLGLDVSSGRLLVASGSNLGPFNGGGPGSRSGVYVLDTAGGVPSASLDSVGTVGATSATLNATANPNGGPPVSYRLEYSTDGTHWSKGPETALGIQETPQSLQIELDPPGEGLQPGTFYHVRFVVTKAFAPPITTSELTLTTLAAGPQAETMGSPIRTATTARLEGRVGPRNAATTYHFEYGTQGPCDANPCVSRPSRDAGSGGLIRFVSEDVTGLEPDTTYHYRLVAENVSTSFGEDMTLTTWASDAPLTHGRFPGPPGSDRAYEQVSAPETGGNPSALGWAGSFSDNGDRATYGVAGGTPASDTGSAFSQFFAERTPSGWQTRNIYPKRDELVGSNWRPPAGASDLSMLYTNNFVLKNAGPTTFSAIFRISPDAPAEKVFQAFNTEVLGVTASDDGSVATVLATGTHDPDFPVARADTANLYELSSGTPRLVSQLPDGTVAPCGIEHRAYPADFINRFEHWISPDSSHVFFPSRGEFTGNCEFPPPPQLYVRNLEVGETKLITGAPVSPPLCSASFIKSTPGAAFFWTATRLVAEDTAPGKCSSDDQDGDVYRYDLDSEELDCVTCVVTGLSADVLTGAFVSTQISVANDGSRVYFQSPNRLMPGAQAPGIYRVNVESGELAYVGPGDDGGFGEGIGEAQGAINPDGSVLVFKSSNPALNPLNGTDNGGMRQYYRYDDRDRSLICVSCPVDGSPAGAEVSPFGLTSASKVAPNITPLSNDGVLVFATPTALVGADQNTPPAGERPERGYDIYEWRDGRLLLITDGLLNWPVAAAGGAPPEVGGITPSGRDVFFVAAAQYTPDALDAYNRLYDARIGGGFEFPPPPKPCPLEVCQGIPNGAPEEQAPGTGAFAGPGNVASAPSNARCPKGKRKMRRGGKARCVKPVEHKRTKKRANENRRAGR
jgi:hypothetical protein